ncbi:type VII secretion protein EccB [Streptoalloteichus hindustanus]|uniref:Type VII secretion protein EccB n=2 Tax=Streptoalloteichus hindustanus TaxID=2017 RepID=A0A1M4TEP4_STRHI|nr:type VII secretion protein EccB [Streptoalloteichus hindustanus]
MPSTPTTKSQVQAYRFVLRRMESALTRKDAVMLHEPMRTHQRALAAGALLAVVGVLGFLIFGVLKPKGSLPKEGGIVISKQTGAVYVVAGNPQQLIPTPNIASAKLLLMARAQKGGQGGGPAGAGPGPGGGDPIVVDETALQNTPKGPLTGMPGAPEMLPTHADQQAVPVWSVCDELRTDPTAPQEKKPDVETTALIGVEQTIDPLGDNRVVLVRASNGQHYLLYTNKKDRRTVVRGLIDVANQQVMSALRLTNVEPRPISTALLNTIPEVGRVEAPAIPGQNGEPNFSIRGAKVGNVVRAYRTGQAEEYFVVLRDGVQQVPQAVAELIRYSDPKTGAVKPIDVPPADVAKTAPDAQKLKIDDLPVVTPEKALGVAEAPVTCLRWSGKDGKPETSVTVGRRVPLPDKMRPVKLAQYKLDNLENIDLAFMPPGKGAVVRSVNTQMDVASGPISVVSDRGVRYGVPSEEIAKGLGLGEKYAPAPQSILQLLPNGPALDPAMADRIYDSLPVDQSAPKAELPPGEQQGGQANGQQGTGQTGK